MDSLKSKWNEITGSDNQPAEQDSLFGTVEQTKQECCASLSLTYKQRFYGVLYCLLAGFGLSILAIILLAVGSIVGFAVCYTLGTICALVGSCFLWGPWKQLKSMFKENRWLTTLVLLACIAMTLVSAFVWASAGLCFLFCFGQFLAYTWYCLSYIPYARKAVGSCLQSVVGSC